MHLHATLVRTATILALMGGLMALAAAAWLCIAVPTLVLVARRHRYMGSWWALYVLGLHAALAPSYRGLRATAGEGNFPSRLLALIYQALTIAAGAEIPLGVTLGDGLLLGHTAGVVMNGLSVLGENCIVGPGVVLGSDGRGRVPVIGKNVYIGANAVIAGPAIVGDHATIGAGSTIINRQIPSCALVVGNPGVIVKENYRRSYHNYAKESGCE
jgi:serine acetyltransferase